MATTKPYILELPAPVEVRRKCKCCAQPLGAQNPGWVCSNCIHTK